MVAVLDERGGMSRAPAGIRFVCRSKGFLRATRAVSKMDYVSFVPSGYPNVMCFRPPGDAMDLIDEGWYGDWVSFILQWDAACSSTLTVCFQFPRLPSCLSSSCSRASPSQPGL